jgi:hypothetical protein
LHVKHEEKPIDPNQLRQNMGFEVCPASFAATDALTAYSEKEISDSHYDHYSGAPIYHFIVLKMGIKN